MALLKQFYLCAAYNKPLASLINHLFLHQLHHRGQVTILPSQSG